MLVAHSGFYGCEYCKTEGKGLGTGVDYTFSKNWDQELRTADEWKEIASKVRDGVPVDSYGITGYSPLLDLEDGFDSSR